MSKVISLLLGFVCMGVSLYVQYSILSLLPVDRLIWFLYWVNIPLFFFVQILLKLGED